MNKIITILLAMVFMISCERAKPENSYLNIQKLEVDSLNFVYPPNENMRRLAEFTCHMSVLLFQKETIEAIKQSDKWRLFSLEAGKSNFQNLIKLSILEEKIIWLNLNIQTPLGENNKIIFPETLSSKEVKYDRLFLKRSGKKIEILLNDDRATCLYPVDTFRP